MTALNVLEKLVSPTEPAWRIMVPSSSSVAVNGWDPMDWNPNPPPKSPERLADPIYLVVHFLPSAAPW